MRYPVAVVLAVAAFSTLARGLSAADGFRMQVEPDRTRIDLRIEGDVVTIECKVCELFKRDEAGDIEFNGSGDVRVVWSAARKRAAKAERVAIRKDKIIMESVTMEVDGNVMKARQVEWTKTRVKAVGTTND